MEGCGRRVGLGEVLDDAQAHVYPMVDEIAAEVAVRHEAHEFATTSLDVALPNPIDDPLAGSRISVRVEGKNGIDKLFRPRHSTASQRYRVCCRKGARLYSLSMVSHHTATLVTIPIHSEHLPKDEEQDEDN